MSIPKPSVTVLRGILHDNAGRFLFLKRSSKSRSWPDKWEFPGGKVDPGEDLMSALKREFLEETGLHILPGKQIAAFCYERTDDVIDYKIFLVDLVSGNVTISDEHSAVRWVDKKELPGLDVSPPLIPVIEGL